MSDSYSIFKDIGSISMTGPVTIKTAADHSQTITNTNPYTNFGQHASGGRMDVYQEGRGAVSAPAINPPKMMADPKPIHERGESAPVVTKSAPTSIERAPNVIENAPAFIEPQRSSLQVSPQPLPQTPRDRPPPNSKETSNDFAELWTVALQKYKKKTGVDIQDSKDEFVQLFEDCKDSSVALVVLERLPVFKKPGAQAPWGKMKGSLKKVLDVVIVLNSLAAEVGNVVLPKFGKLIFVGTGLLLKGTRDITKESEGLEKLFSRLAAFLSRLEVRGRAKIQPSSQRIIIKILVELLNALAIATVMVRGNLWTKVKRIGNKVLFEEDEIEKVLSRLSDLTEEESSMVLAELVASRDDLKELVGGLDATIRGLAWQLRSNVGIGNFDKIELDELSALLQSTRADDKTEVLRVLQLLKMENDGTQTTLNHIETEVRELRKSLARDVDLGSTNGQAAHTSGNGDSSSSGKSSSGGNVEIRAPQTTAPPVNFEPRRQERPSATFAGTSRDAYGSYANMQRTERS